MYICIECTMLITVVIMKYSGEYAFELNWVFDIVLCLGMYGYIFFACSDSPKDISMHMNQHMHGRIYMI